MRSLGALLVFILSGWAGAACLAAEAPPEEAAPLPWEPSPELLKLPATEDYALTCMRPSWHHAYYEAFTCPIGGEKFRNIVHGVHSTYGRYLDWKPVSYMDLPYPVPICPNGFAMYKKEFSEEELKRYRSVIESEAYKKLFAKKHATYYLMAKQFELAGEANENRWRHMLQASWEADSCESDKYALYVGETIDAAKAHLESVKPSDNLYWVLNIIIPNMYRRTGRFDEAQAWLDGIDRQALEAQEDNDFIVLAFDLLEKAVSEKKTERIEIKKPEPEKPEEEAEDQD